MTSAEARDTLKHLGYFNITRLTRQPDGSWTAEAQRQFYGSPHAVHLDRNGTAVER